MLKCICKQKKNSNFWMNENSIGILKNIILEVDFNIYDKSDCEVGKQAWPRIADINTPNQSQKFTENTRLKGILVTKNTEDNLITCIKRKNINIIKNDIRFDDVFASEKIKINSFQDENLFALRVCVRNDAIEIE